MSFVLTQLLQLSASPGNPYSGLIDPQRIAMAGHSLGGMTTVGVTANSCCIDERFKAAIVVAGAARSFGHGDFFVAPTHVPMMVVHGDSDTVVPFAQGRKVFDDAAPPKVMLTLVGGGHGTPYVGDSSDSQAHLVEAATLDFLDLYVKGRADGLDRLRAAVASNPEGRLDVQER